MINAFLWFESKKEGNENRFSELSNRIKSMSLIHEYLCNSKDLVHIDAQVYLDEIIKTIMQTYSNNKIRVSKDIQNINISFDNIMSLGIILNETISNSIKHHHNNKTEITLEISCYKIDNQIILKIKDNGDGFDENKAGFGLKLIKDFTKKLPNASYSFTMQDGSIFELIFEDIL
jgi:two-component sensor histidine kinase